MLILILLILAPALLAWVWLKRRTRAARTLSALIALLLIAACDSSKAPTRALPPPQPPIAVVLPAAPVVSGTSVGYLSSSAEVAKGGDMTVHLPLDVPPGVAGMEPSLSLDYSSHGGSGPLGRGFSLTGASSSMTRCPKSFAVDGTRAGIAFQSSDVYCLDGQKLTYVSGSEFRTEEDTQARIVMAGSLAVPTGFTVYLKNGHIRSYLPLAPAQRVSATVQALTPASPVILEWPLADETDRSGNGIHYAYTQIQNPAPPYDEEIRLDHIDYTSGPNGEPARRSVKLEYEDRLDPSFGYHHGIRYKAAKRLSKIQMLAPNPSATSLVWEYRLTYLDNGLLGHTLLESVQKCGYLGTCTFAKHFGWKLDGTPAIYGSPEPYFAGFIPSGTLVFDANGDGKDDILYELDLPDDGKAKDVEIHLLLSQPGPGANFTDLVVNPPGSPMYLVSVQKSRAVDFHGDGRIDLLAFVDNNSLLKEYRPLFWSDVKQAFAWAGPAIQARELDLVDADGDGLLDLMGFSPPDQRWIRLSNGDGTFQPPGALSLLPSGCAAPPLGGDFDANGRGELLVGASLDCSLAVAVGRDDSGAVVATPSVPLRWNQHETQLADLNGDGLVDAFWLSDTLEISFNTGNGFAPPFVVSDAALDSVFALNPDPTKRSVMAMDVDRDGRADLVFTVRDHLDPFGSGEMGGGGYLLDVVTALLSNGDGTFRRQDFPAVDPGLGIRTGDFDGDGTRDLLTVTTDGSFHVYYQAGEDADLLVEVHDGDAPTSHRLDVGYGRTSPEDWKDASCTFPTLCGRQGTQVVAWAAGLDLGGTTTYYRFEEPRADLHGRGPLGFARVRLWNPSVPIESTTTFDNATLVGTMYPNAQRPKMVRTVVPIVAHGPDGALDTPASSPARIAETTYEYDVHPSAGGVAHFVYTQAAHEEVWEEDVDLAWNLDARVHLSGIDGPGPKGAPRVHDASYRVDDYANAEGMFEQMIGGVAHEVDRTYDLRPADWLVGLLKTTEEASYDAAELPVWLHTANHFDPLGQLDTSTIEPDGTPDVKVARTITHDARGRVTQETRTAAGEPDRVRHFAYDDVSGEGVFVSEQWDDIDKSTVLARWSYAIPATGGTMEVVDANGGSATTIHDDLGRPVSVTGAGGKPASMAYSAWEDAGGFTAGLEVQADDAMGGHAVTRTDERGLVVERRRVAFDGQTSVEDAAYDRFGRLLWESRPGFGTASPHGATRSFDSLNRVLVETAPDKAAVTHTYTFFESTTTDPMLRVRTTVQDADRRVVSATDFLYGQPLETTYTYVRGSLPETVTDPQGNLVVSTYDVRGRRMVVVDSNAGARTTQYNGFGDVVATVDPALQTTSYTRDRLGRIAESVSLDGKTQAQWDSRPHGLGKMAESVSPDGTVVDHYYDDLGRPAHTDWTVAGKLFSVEQTYDVLGRPDELRYPEVPNRARMVVRPVHNGQGYVSEIDATDEVGTSHPAWTVVERDAGGALLEGMYGTKLTTSRKYDPVSGRLKGMYTAGSVPVLGLEYDYYADGRVYERRDLVGQRVEDFAYDDLRRLSAWTLTTSSGMIHTTYGFDDLGNMKEVDVEGVPVETNLYTGAAPHQVTERGGVTFHHDERGRLDQSTAGLAIAYTDTDLPRSITQGGVTTAMRYDADSHRVQKQGPAGTTVYVGGLYERRTDASGTKHIFYVSGPDGAVAQVVYDEAAGADTVAYLHQDAQGSVLVATGEKGDEHDRLFFEPYGRRTDVAGKAVAAPAGDVHAGYTGARHDDELGLIDMHGRTYDPVLRQFLQPDPFVADAYGGQTYNRYSYVANDPVNLVDPTGYVEKEIVYKDGGTVTVGDNGAPTAAKSPVIVITGTPVDSPPPPKPTEDDNGEGTAVLDQEPHRDSGYPGSSTSGGLQGNTVGVGAPSPLRPCHGDGDSGCESDTAGTWFLRNGQDLQDGALYLSAGAVWAAAAVVAVPTMAVGGLAAGGAGLVGGVSASGVAAGATAVALPAAALASTPTGQEIIEASETIGATGAETVAERTVNLFRAVSPAEFADVVENGGFRSVPGTMAGKQFGLVLDEVLSFANKFSDIAAVLRVEIPESTFKALEFSRAIDPFIFRNGVVTAQPGGPLELLNNTIVALEHVM